MRKFKKLLSSQKRQPNPARPPAAGPTQPITPTSQPAPIENPPSYYEDQIDRLHDELQQVQLQLSEIQSRSSNLRPSTIQALNPAPHVAGEVPNYASIQAPQAQHQVNQSQDRLRREEAGAIALLLEHGWDTVLWKPNHNQEQRNTALYWAATNGHITAVRYLVQNGASGMTGAVGVGWEKSALASAAEANHVAIVQIIMEQATEEMLQNNSALGAAAREGRVEVVRLLLRKWPSVAKSHYCSREGALSFAAERGHETIVRLILEKGVDYAVQSEMGGRVPLYCAVNAGQTAMVQLLLEDLKLARDGFNRNTTLSKAEKRRHGTIIRMLINRGVAGAVSGGKDSILRLLLKAGGETSSFLDNAVSTGNQSTVQLLLDYGAKASKGLKSAALVGNTSIARLLLDHGAAVDVLDNRKRTPLHVAVHNGRKEVAELLLEKGANVVAQDDEGKTPLYFAVVSQHKATVNLVLEHGAANSWIGKGHIQKAFVEAVRKGATEVIQLLMDYGFQFNFNEGSEEKLLGVAAEKGFQAIVQLLLDNGANIDGKDYRGRTALHLAAMNGHYEIVMQLLWRGADPLVRNMFGRTAKYWAVQNGHTLIAQLLPNDSSLYRPEAKDQAASEPASQTKELPESGLQSVAKQISPSTMQSPRTQHREDSYYLYPSVLRWD